MIWYHDWYVIGSAMITRHLCACRNPILFESRFTDIVTFVDSIQWIQITEYQTYFTANFSCTISNNMLTLCSLRSDYYWRHSVYLIMGTYKDSTRILRYINPATSIHLTADNRFQSFEYCLDLFRQYHPIYQKCIWLFRNGTRWLEYYLPSQQYVFVLFKSNANINQMAVITSNLLRSRWICLVPKFDSFFKISAFYVPQSELEPNIIDLLLSWAVNSN